MSSVLKNYAVQCLNVLSDYGRWMGTAEVMRIAGIEKSKRPMILGILAQLNEDELSIVEKRGSNPLEWRILNENWNRNDPFLGQPIKGAAARSPGSRPRRSRVGVSSMSVTWDDDGTPTVDDTPAEDPADIVEAPDYDPPTEGTVSSKLLKTMAESIQTLQSGMRLLSDQNDDLQNQIVSLNKDLEATRKMAETSVKTIIVKKPNGTTKKIKGSVLPPYFDTILQLAQARRNIMLVGPAGCGKTYISNMVAKSLDLPFYSISCSSGMSEAHLTGRSIPNFKTGTTSFQTTEFLKPFETGGVFLMDEFDASDSNALLVLNNALDNGFCVVPNREKKPRAERHEDFVLIATANTYGKGATREYAGRNQLDEATLNRFQIGVVECDYDQNVETSLCPDKELRELLWKVRNEVRTGGIRRVVSTRFIRDAYLMRSQFDWELHRVFDVLTSGWTTGEMDRVKWLRPTVPVNPSATQGA